MRGATELGSSDGRRLRRRRCRVATVRHRRVHIVIPSAA